MRHTILSLSRKKALIICIAFLLLNETVNIQPLLAQNVFQRVWRRFTTRPDPEGRPASLNTGGANRDLCHYTEEELTALVPTSEKTNFPYLEQTVSEYPTWYFYIPYTSKSNYQSEFVLIDEDEEILYKKNFSLEKAPGIFEFTLPKSISGLSTGKSYRWVFSIICMQNNRSGDATVNGWIRKVEKSQDSSALESKNSYLYYLDKLLWFDAVNQLVRLKTEDPNNPELQSAWNQLEETVSLEQLPFSIYTLSTEE